VAVNAFGDVVDPRTGEIIAGARKPVVGGFLNTAERMKGDLEQTILAFASTTIGVVATNACLTKEQTNKVAQMAHNGLAMAIRPAHTMFDGDTIFALSLGKQEGDVSVIGSVAAEVMAQAVVRAVTQAEGLLGVPAARDLATDSSG